MNNFRIAVTLINSVQHLVQTAFGAAIEPVTGGIAKAILPLEPGDAHANKTYRGGLVFIPPTFEQGPGHAVQCSCVV